MELLELTTHVRHVPSRGLTDHEEGPVPEAKSCPCPQCQADGVWLESLSRDAHVDYYRCALCAHIWNVPKDNCEPTQDVTVRM
jgi:hypothetical protein